jgi:hypothetical protein
MLQNLHKIIALVFVLFLVGCALKSTTQLANVRTGTEGLKVSVLKNLPTTMFEQQKLQIDLELANNGAADIENAFILVSGYDYDLIEMDSKIKENINLRGKSIYTPYGEKSLVNFGAETKEISQQLKEDTTKITFTSCYKYETLATTDVCINPNIQSTAKELCKPKTTTLSSQGAPVAVKKVEENILYYGNDLTAEFRIYVSNVGNGKIRAKDTYYKECKGISLEYADVDIVNMEAYLSNQKICTETLKMKTADENFFVCRIKIDPSQGIYITPLIINLSYGYSSPTELSLKIKNSPTLITSECSGKKDGDKCGDNHACINGICSEKTLCDYFFAAESYSCNSLQKCTESTVKKGFCPGPADYVCCKPKQGK